MSTIATVIGLAAAVCTTAANLPQLKKAWITGQTIFVDGGLTLYADFREPWSSE